MSPVDINPSLRIKDSVNPFDWLYGSTFLGRVKMLASDMKTFIQKEDLELTPFNNMGGLQKYYQLFGNNYEIILEELNYALVA